MDQNRFTKKRQSLVGGGLAKFEGAEAADQFARRQSSYNTRVRQSIPDIRFDENGMPISTRQLQARSQSLAGGSLLPPGGRYGRDGVRRGSDFIPSGGEKNVRKLSKKFSSTEEDELKTNFTIPENSRAGMFGTNRRWSVKPEWMKKRKSSVKEEFIEKNLSNLEMMSPTSPTSPTSEEEMMSISEELAPSGEDKMNHSTSSESSSEEEFSDSDSDDELSDGETEIENGDVNQKPDVDKDIDTVENGAEHLSSDEQDGLVKLKSTEVTSPEKKVKRMKKKRKVKQGKTAVNGDLPARPPPPPLPVEMCDITKFQEEESSSSEEEVEDVIRTEYGKQKLFVSSCYHVFETRNGPLNNGRELTE